MVRVLKRIRRNTSCRTSFSKQFIGNCLKDLRKGKGHSVREAALLANIGVKTLDDIEEERILPTLRNISLLSSFFNIPFYTLTDKVITSRLSRFRKRWEEEFERYRTTGKYKMVLFCTERESGERRRVRMTFPECAKFINNIRTAEVKMFEGHKYLTVVKFMKLLGVSKSHIRCLSTGRVSPSLPFIFNVAEKYQFDPKIYFIIAMKEKSILQVRRYIELAQKYEPIVENEEEWVLGDRIMTDLEKIKKM